VTEDGTSDTPIIEPRGSEIGGWAVSDMCLQERGLPHRRLKGSAEMRFWYLPLGVVLKRVMKGIWWMPWH
jgi:hypothetical protein